MKRAIGILLLATMMTGCQIVGMKTTDSAELAPVPFVDIDRFMGDWYVIAAIPARIEREAFNAIESYKLNEDGSIATTYTFRKGGFDGKAKRYTPTGFVLDKDSNAIWGMRFIWPFKADYRIIYLTGDYQHTIIGRNKRDYVWIMSRTPKVSEPKFSEMMAVISSVGYDSNLVRRIPHQW